uniref:ubiquitinyl hydrolase 1 n=1 Tax=Gongylonema pulchrum TaxID=637853 RepID=A0A183E8W6_9BILA
LYEMLNMFVEVWTKEINVLDEMSRQSWHDQIDAELKASYPCCSLKAIASKAIKNNLNDDFTVLSLSLPTVFGQTLTLPELLKNYFALEYLEDASSVIPNESFQRLPSLLIIRVERVGYSGGTFKRYEHVFFPEFLDLRPFCLSKSEKGGEEHCLTGNYQLRAVSVHSGNANGGHFITYRRGIGADNVSTWYRTSDAEVTCFFRSQNFHTFELYSKKGVNIVHILVVFA